MKNSHSIPWKRIAVESFAIVASILLAFGIDAWWDERVERSEEQVLLTRLSAEFSTNLERMERLKGFALILDANLKLHDLIEKALLDGVQTAEAPTGMLRLALISVLFEAEVPLLDALTKAGKLDLIDDSRIVKAVAVWERQLRDYTSAAERNRRYIDTLLLPALYKRSDIAPVHLAPHITRENGTDPMWSVPVVIVVDEELKGIVAGRYDLELAAQSDIEQLREAAVDVIDAINAANASQ